jgi:hypothetical protein
MATRSKAAAQSAAEKTPELRQASSEAKKWGGSKREESAQAGADASKDKETQHACNIFATLLGNLATGPAFPRTE